MFSFYIPVKETELVWWILAGFFYIRVNVPLKKYTHIANFDRTKRKMTEKPIFQFNLFILSTSSLAYLRKEKASPLYVPSSIRAAFSLK